MVGGQLRNQRRQTLARIVLQADECWDVPGFHYLGGLDQQVCAAGHISGTGQLNEDELGEAEVARGLGAGGVGVE